MPNLKLSCNNIVFHRRNNLLINWGMNGGFRFLLIDAVPATWEALSLPSLESKRHGCRGARHIEIGTSIGKPIMTIIE